MEDFIFRIIKSLAQIVVLSLIISGCTPANVSLNSEFGSSEGPFDKTPNDSTTPSTPLVPVTVLTLDNSPTHINIANTSSAFFSGTCRDVGFIDIKINDASFSLTPCLGNAWNASLDLTAVPDGDVEFKFSDSSAASTNKTASLKKDTLRPNAILFAPPAALNNFLGYTISVIASDDYDLYSFKIGKAPATDCSLAFGYSAFLTADQTYVADLSALSDGNFVVCLIGKDKYGNEQLFSAATAHSWVRDTTPPVVSFVTATNINYINAANSSSFSITLACSENGQMVFAKAIAPPNSIADSGGICSAGTYTRIVNLSGLADGPVDFEVTQTDAASNATITVVRTIPKDTIGPIFTVNNVVHNSFHNSVATTPIFSWTNVNDGATGTGFNYFKIGFGTSSASPDISAFINIASSRNYQYLGLSNPLIEGTSYYPIVRAYDLAGNFTEISSSGWKPDVTGPTIGAINDGTFSAPGKSTTATWSAPSADLSGIALYEYSIGTSPGNADIISWTSTGLLMTAQVDNAAFTLGSTYYFSVRATDAVGNIGIPINGDGFRIKNLVTTVFSNSMAHVALKPDGHLISWGDADSGGQVPLPANLTTGPLTVLNVVPSYDAFAALMSDGSVIPWGNPVSGGSLGATGGLNGTIDVVAMTATLRAFAARRDNGSVITWGDSNYGGDSSSVSAALASSGPYPINTIVSTNAAFAAIRSNGSVIAWGHSSYGGSTAGKETSLGGSVPVVSIASTNSAFAALRSDGSVITWGLSTYGGDSTSVASQINGASKQVVSIVSNDYAFAALRNDGSVVTWGSGFYGGDSSAVSIALNSTVRITAVYKNKYSFAALRADGSVITWGDASYGGDSSAVATSITGSPFKVTSIASTDGAFAALRENGSVIVWGNASYGNSVAAVSAAINGTIPVTSIKATEKAFAALRSDGSVITWGSVAQGGDSGSVALLVNGTVDVTSLFSNPFSFAAVRTDGTLVTWGDASYGGDSSSVNP